MSSSSDPFKLERPELIEALVRAVYENSTAAVFFHTAMAEQLGLGASEEKTLFILSEGPLTAGEIATRTGLATASVTGLIDRLEKKGFVHRVRDTADRRRVIVQLDPDRFAELTNLFNSVGAAFTGLIDNYSDFQLATITDFLTRTVEHSKVAVERLARET